MIRKTKEAWHQYQSKGNGPTVCPIGRPRSTNLVSCPPVYALNLFLVVLVPLKRSSTLLLTWTVIQLHALGITATSPRVRQCASWTTNISSDHATRK